MSVSKQIDRASGAMEPKDLFFAPIDAVQKLMAKDGRAIGDYEVIEVNEAFAVQAIADMRGLGMDEDRVNVNGGAVALGHPAERGTCAAMKLGPALRAAAVRVAAC